MTISAPARRRWPGTAVAGIAGLAVGLAVGLAIAGGGEDSNPVDVAREARATALRAATLLEIVPIEYAQTENGDGDSREGLAGARGAVTRSRAMYLEARPVIAVLDPEGARVIDAAYPRLDAAIGRRAPAGEVQRQSRQLMRLLDRR